MSCCCEYPSSGSLIFGGQIVHINEGKGKLALFLHCKQCFTYPSPFHNFIIFLPQFFYSLLHNFTILIFSLLLLLLLLLHRPLIDPTSTPHRPYIDSTSTPHRPHIDLTSTLHRPHIDPTSTPHRPHIDPTST